MGAALASTRSPASTPARSRMTRPAKAPVAPARPFGGLGARFVCCLDEAVRVDAVDRRIGFKLPVLHDGVARRLHLLRVDHADALGAAGLIPHRFDQAVDGPAYELLVHLRVELADDPCRLVGVRDGVLEAPD